MNSGVDQLGFDVLEAAAVAAAGDLLAMW